MTDKVMDQPLIGPIRKILGKKKKLMGIFFVWVRVRVKVRVSGGQ